MCHCTFARPAFCIALCLPSLPSSGQGNRCGTYSWQIGAACLVLHDCDVACLQVLEGLRYLHEELHVVHRDIKPSNLLLNSAGQVKIGDFGVSKQLSDDTSKCMTWIGTVPYMSPERITAGASGYGKPSDVWSLGVTLMEAALGRFPYPHKVSLRVGYDPRSDRLVLTCKLL